MMNKLVLLCLCLGFGACASYNCQDDPQPTVPLFLQGVSLKEANGQKLSIYSRGAMLYPGENTLTFTRLADGTIASDKTYNMDLNAKEHTEYIATIDNTQICIFERNKYTKQPILSAAAGCVDL